MALGEQLGDKTAADVNQYVHSWLDDADRRLRKLVSDLLSMLASAAVAALKDWSTPKE